MSDSVTLSPEEVQEISISYGTIISTGILAILVCGTRLYVRKFIVASFGIDDWACLFGLLFVTAFNGIGLAVVHYGAGKHIQHVSQDHLAHWFMLYYVCICMYLSISFAVKSNLLLFLRRVFPNTYMQRTTTGLLIFLTLFTISGTFVAAFQCNPPKYTYDINFLMSPDRAKHCFSADTSYGIFMYQAVLIFICDVVMLVLPIPALMQLNLSSSNRMALVLVFASAGVACIAPAIRFKSLQFYKTGSTDTTFDGASSLYWMAIEYNLGLVAGSLTSLRPLLAKFGLLRTKLDSDRKYSDKRHSHRLEDTPPNRWARYNFKISGNKHQGDSVLVTTMNDEETLVDGSRMREHS